MAELPTPHTDSLPGGWIETPAEPSRQQSYIGNQSNNSRLSPAAIERESIHNPSAGTYLDYSANVANNSTGPDFRKSSQFSASSHSTVVPSPAEPVEHHESFPRESVDERDSDEEDKGGFTSIKPASSAPARPKLPKQDSKPMTEEDLFRVVSRRRTNSVLGRVNTGGSTTTDDDEEQEEINRLMSRMFGRTRQAQSDEEKTRHLGVIFKNLTVKGAGLGAALQPSVGDFFLGPSRFFKNLFSKGPRKAAAKPPVRTLIDDFSGCIKPGEMLLVLGRPGAGCSTFLKMIGNQRFGYEDITGDVTYGGTDSEEMRKRFRSEVLYNPEDDLHYATLKVKDTLRFALKTRTPGKGSRNEGESRQDYVKEFLRVISKLFWIEHTMDTKVGNELVRGVSGGEKKRVSIAEAMVTKVCGCEKHFYATLILGWKAE
jgi:ATP-binding cassette subfamily G (WHITE) protein 2 (SNQ2)